MKRAELNMVETIFVLIIFIFLIFFLFSKLFFLTKTDANIDYLREPLLGSDFLKCSYSVSSSTPCVDLYKLLVLKEDAEQDNELNKLLFPLLKNTKASLLLLTPTEGLPQDFINSFDSGEFVFYDQLSKDSFSSLLIPALLHDPINKKFYLSIIILRG